MKIKILLVIQYLSIISMVGFLTAMPLFGEISAPQTDEKEIYEMADPLTLAFCIETALKNNPDLSASRNEKNIAAFEREIAEGERWPQLKFKGGISTYMDEQRLISARYNGEQGVFSQDMSDIGVSVRMPLYTGGRIVHMVRAAELTESVFSDRFIRSGQELTFNVNSAFYTILGRKHQLKSIEFARDVLQKDRVRIESLIHAKKAAASDLLRIDVRLAQVEQQWVQVRNEIHVAYRVLFNLMGLQTGFGDAVPTLAGDLKPLPSTPEVKGAYEAALMHRPDYLAAKSGIEAQMERVKAARSLHWPNIYLDGAYGYRFAGDTSDRPEGADTAEDRGNIGLTLEMPLFEGGRTQAKVRRESEKMASLKARLTALRLRIQKEVEIAVFNMESARLKVEAQETAVTQARDVLRIEQEKYRLGKGTVLDVLDSQRAVLDIETTYYRALADYHIAIAQFRMAKGEAS